MVANAWGRDRWSSQWHAFLWTAVSQNRVDWHYGPFRMGRLSKRQVRFDIVVVFKLYVYGRTLSTGEDTLPLLDLPPTFLLFDFFKKNGKMALRVCACAIVITWKFNLKNVGKTPCSLEFIYAWNIMVNLGERCRVVQNLPQVLVRKLIVLIGQKYAPLHCGAGAFNTTTLVKNRTFGKIDEAKTLFWSFDIASSEIKRAQAMSHGDTHPAFTWTCSWSSLARRGGAWL